MQPYLTTTVCFFLIIGIGHVNALPLTTHNQLVPREDFSILKKSLYTRADEGDSGPTEGPVTDDEPQHKKAKLDHSGEEVVSSALGAPKTRKALPTVGQPRGPNARPTLDDIRAKAGSERLAFQYRDTITDVDARNLLKAMIDGQLETDPLPWKRDEVWSDEVLRTMIQVLRGDQKKVISKEYTKDQKEALKQGKKTSTRVKKMDRQGLEDELDVLWKWAVERHDGKGGPGSKDLVKIKEGELVVDDEKLLWLLFRNAPKDTSDMSKMPWREAKFQWKAEWVQALLMRIWSTQHERGHKKFKEPEVRFNVEISSLEGEQREAAMKKAMDDAWKWWVEYAKTKNL